MIKLDTKAAFQIDEAGAITGTAWPFGSPDRVGDIIEKGAFAGTMLPLPMLFGHNPNDPVGVWTDLEETDTGLVVKGHLLVGQVARADEINALIQAKALSGLSIGFSKAKGIVRKSAGRIVGRTISDLTLEEISFVTIPCHPGARVLTAKNASHSIADAINRAAVRGGSVNLHSGLSGLSA